MAIKIHIVYQFTSGPWGGGNQFLKSLRNYLRSKEMYVEQAKDADVIVFNSHHHLMAAAWLKFRYPYKAFVHRLDNLMFLARGKGTEIDNLITTINRRISDGTVFQSEWCKEKFIERGLAPFLATVIHNAPDSAIFYPDKLRNKRNSDKRMKLISVSWSTNPRKGFPVYQYLDAHLDFNRYQMTFVGNSPVAFKHINHFPPMESGKLAELLRAHDIFISASEQEACPNALIEALHCGLVPVVIDSGSHRELMKDQGVLFNGVDDLIDTIDETVRKIDYFRSALHPESISQVGERYSDFCTRVVRAGSRKRLSLASISLIAGVLIKMRMMKAFRRAHA